MSGEGVSGWQLKVGGRALPAATCAAMRELEVVRQLEHASRFCLTLADPDLSLVDSAQLPLGAAVEISLRHAGKEGLVFEGEVTAWGLERTPRGTHLLVRGLDRSHRLLRSQRVRFVEARDDSSLLRAVARDHALTPGPAGPPAAPGGGGPAGQLQLGDSDLALLLARGKRHGQQPGLQGKQLSLAAPSLTSPPKLLEHGQAIGRCELSCDLSQLPTGVEVLGWDLKRHKRIEGRAGPQDVKWPGEPLPLAVQKARRAFGEAVQVLAEEHPADAREATRMARAALQQQVERALRGVVWVSGFPMLTPGQRLRLQGESFPLPGIYRVITVHYLLTGAGGSTRLEVIRPQVA